MCRSSTVARISDALEKLEHGHIDPLCPLTQECLPAGARPPPNKPTPNVWTLRNLFRPFWGPKSAAHLCSALGSWRNWSKIFQSVEPTWLPPMPAGDQVPETIMSPSADLQVHFISNCGEGNIRNSNLYLSGLWKGPNCLQSLPDKLPKKLTTPTQTSGGAPLQWRGLGFWFSWTG